MYSDKLNEMYHQNFYCIWSTWFMNTITIFKMLAVQLNLYKPQEYPTSLQNWLSYSEIHHQYLIIEYSMQDLWYFIFCQSDIFRGWNEILLNFLPLIFFYVGGCLHMYSDMLNTQHLTKILLGCLSFLRYSPQQLQCTNDSIHNIHQPIIGYL